jgi:hypothetical protein
VKIKGSALLARKEIITRRFGVAAWQSLLSDMAREHACFRTPVVAASLLPVREFLEFHDELLRRFYRGEPRAYFELGEESARWALVEGPYRKFLARKDVEAFVASIPNLSNAYWERSGVSYAAALDGGVVELRVAGLPLWHPYFEYLVVGYIRTALELLQGKPVESERIIGGSGEAYTYRFHLEPRPPSP